MTDHCLTEVEPATPEYVFEYFAAVYRHAVSLREAQPDQLPNLDTTIREYYNSLLADDMTWEQHAAALNETFHSAFPLSDLEPITSPPNVRTLRDVCQFFGSRIDRPVIRPWRGIGPPCLSAGAFLTVRDVLEKMGEDTSALRPSTTLEPTLRRKKWRLVERLVRIAPENIPPYWMTHRFERAALVLFLLSIISLVAALPTWMFAGGMVARYLAQTSFALFPAAISLFAIGHLLPPISTGLGDLRTFRDLAYCLAGEEPRRRAA